jgi:helicase MOV-10
MIFFDSNSKRRFPICKPLAAVVGNKEDFELLKPVAPYVPIKLGQQEPVHEIVPGRRPESVAPVEWFTKLEQYNIPKLLKRILDIPNTTERMRRIKGEFLPRELTADTHAKWFHVLLYLEEHQSE